ncbi:hypothetical protein [Micromonospora sp. 4G55]|uniref:hypothetical protein n=1 Tax=Micromonospora sp. 4G55 TaxID=2806102 RepID=UPI001A603A81|nr:hypothetical protein [Micromonospora sp. 4G55]MBM0255538.1 hypothetical protein [Micromonospora sp. 4G55]
MTTVEVLRRHPASPGIALLTALLLGGCSGPSGDDASATPSPTVSSQVEMQMIVPPEKLGFYRSTTDPAVNGETGKIAAALAQLLDGPLTSSVAISYQDPRYPDHTSQVSAVSGRVGDPDRTLDAVFTEIHRVYEVTPVAAGQWGGRTRFGKAQDIDAHICAWAVPAASAR